MVSNIDPTKPTTGLATTQSVRDNFQDAKAEIEALQAAVLNTNGQSVIAFGADPGNTAAVNNAAFQAAFDTGGPVYIPPGEWNIDNGSPAYLRTNNYVRNDGHVIGKLSTVEEYFNYTLRLTNGVTPIALNATVIPGDFSGADWVAAAAASAWVAIQYPNNILGGDANTNQFGIAYAQLVPASANASNITINTGSRWAFPIVNGVPWEISVITGITFTSGHLPGRGLTSVIPCDNADGKYQINDIVRIENLTGNDTYWGFSGNLPSVPPGVDTAYFEYNRVRDISTTSITLEMPIDYDYTNYWVIKSFITSNVVVQGGAVDTLTLHNGTRLFAIDVQSNLTSFAHNYLYGSNSVRSYAKEGQTSWARVMGITNAKNGVLLSPIAAGAYGATDNGSVKYLGVQHLAITGILAYGTRASAQSISPLIGDFYSLPYSCWCVGVTITGGYLGVPEGGVLSSAFLLGHIGLQVNGLSMAGGLRVENSNYSRINANADGGFSTNHCYGIDITGVYPYGRFDNTTLIGSQGLRLTGPGLTNYLLWFRGSNDANIVGYMADGTAADNSVRIENSGTTGPIRFHACRDLAGSGKVSVVASGTNGDVTHDACDWRGTVASIGNGQMIYKGDVYLTDNAYNASRFVLSNRNFYIDATGHLRVSVSTPVADNSGNIIPFLRTGGGSPVTVVTPNEAGEVYIDTTNNRVWFAADGTNTGWIEPPRLLTGTATPVGAVTPTRVGTVYVDTVTPALWFSTGLANTNWVSIPVVGTIASQNANAVAITGGTVAGVTITNSPISGSTVSGTSVTATQDAAGNSGNQAVLRGGQSGQTPRKGISLQPATGSTDTDVDIILAPKGAGAILADIPDNTATGGNIRGTGAVDLQQSRSAATAVASGVGATIVGGVNNAASGSSSVAGGQNSTASGLASLAIGNQATAAGVSSVALGGTSTDRGISGCHVYAGNRFSVNGDAQILDCVHMFSTNAAAAVRLTTDGTAVTTSNTLVLPNTSAYMLSVDLVARDTTAGTAWTYTLAPSLVYRGANAAATVAGTGNPVFVLGPTAGTPAAIATVPTLTADTTNGSINISFTPPVANTNTIHIVARTKVTEVV